MPRPKRILIFGILCLVLGGLILLHNLGQFGVTIAGPDTIQVPSASESKGQVGQVLRDTSLAMRGAMAQPVYRIGLGIKSFFSLLMARMLIGAGIGLLRDQPWAIRLARTWAVYAILSSIAVTVLQSIYLVPNIPVSSAPPGMAVAQYISMFFMLILLCVIPLLLLFVLPTRKVRAYLDPQSAGAKQPHHEPTPSAPTNTTPTPARPPAPPVSAADMTWRDDPWNDPSSN